MKRLYFIRHGESEMNVSGHFAGHTDTPLTLEGKRQAAKAGQQAKHLGKVDYIVCSPLSRAHETAKLVAKAIRYPEKDIHLNSLFVERYFGAMEGKLWSPDIDMDGIADVETEESLLKRARMALDFLESLPQSTIIVVSHGMFGRALRHHVHADFPFSHPHRIGNAEIIQLI